MRMIIAKRFRPILVKTLFETVELRSLKIFLERKNLNADLSNSNNTKYFSKIIAKLYKEKL